MLCLYEVVVLMVLGVVVVDVCCYGLCVGGIWLLLVGWIIFFMLLCGLVEVWLGLVECDGLIVWVFCICDVDEMYCVWLCVEISWLCVLLCG